MIFRSHDAHEHPLHVLAVNGDRVGVDTADLGRFMSCRPFLLFAFAYCVLLVVHNDQIYGVETELWFRMLYYPLNTTVWGLIWILQFWLLERIALLRQSNYVVLTMAIHALPVAVTVHYGLEIVSNYHGVEPIGTREALSHFLKMFLLGLSFEFFVIHWVWPGVTGMSGSGYNGHAVGTYSADLGEFIDSANQKFRRKS